MPCPLTGRNCRTPKSLDNLLRLILQPAEDEYFDSGEVSTQEWMDIARTGFDGTDFDWLMAQLCDKRFESFYRELYDAADVPLAWELGDSSYAKSRNVIRGGKVALACCRAAASPTPG